MARYAIRYRGRSNALTELPILSFHPSREKLLSAYTTASAPARVTIYHQ